MQFNLVICGLDSVEARRWINATLVNLVDPENAESLKPLIDGGTEGMYHLLCSTRLIIHVVVYRIQRTSSSDSADILLLLRMLARHAE